MNLVLNIVLLLFCIGVTYSSGVNSSSDGVTPTVAPEVQPDHVTVHLSTTIQNSSNLQSVTPAPSTVGNSAVKDEPVTAESKSKPPSTTDNNNATAKAKNATAVTEIPKKENTTSTNNSVPAEKKISTEKSTTTTTVATSPSIAAPVVSISDHATPTPKTQERQFDGSSFVGGIVLTVGLTVIGFIAFKFYKSGKIERNYRTL